MIPRQIRRLGLLAPAALVVGGALGFVQRLRIGVISVVEAGTVVVFLVMWGFLAALDSATGGRWITAVGVGLALVLTPWAIWTSWSKGGTVSVAIGCALYLLALDGAWRGIRQSRAA